MDPLSNSLGIFPAMCKTSHQEAKDKLWMYALKKANPSRISWANLKIIYMKTANQNVCFLFKSDQLAYIPLAFT
jgi:hypothetical protein